MLNFSLLLHCFAHFCKHSRSDRIKQKWSTRKEGDEDKKDDFLANKFGNLSSMKHEIPSPIVETTQ